MYVFERYFFPCLYRVLDEGEIAKEQEQWIHSAHDSDALLLVPSLRCG
jgi:hypothetical protein